MKRTSKSKVNPDFDPNKHLYWSKRRIITSVIACTFISIVLVFGFLISQQYRKIELTQTQSEPKSAAPNTRHYANAYWGIEFDYPGTWFQPIGSYQDGEYYFASQPMSFINELEPGEGLIALKTYNNWASLPYSDWLKANKYLFIPAGQLSNPTSTTIKGLPAERYTVSLKNSQNNTSLRDMLIISRNTSTKYVFILETDQASSHDKYLTIFESIISSINFTKVESNPNGK